MTKSSEIESRQWQQLFKMSVMCESMIITFSFSKKYKKMIGESDRPISNDFRNQTDGTMKDETTRTITCICFCNKLTFMVQCWLASRMKGVRRKK
jgi:hypothetical protein